ncbi:MAG: ABC transporter ATP-binding protein [Mycobacteriales bacterium]
MSLLTLEDVVVRYGAVEALKGISLSVEQGEVVTLLGSNGAGKTTTLRTISGLHTPSRGSILLGGEPLTGKPPHVVAAMGVGHVPEGRRVFPRMSVAENLEMGAYRDRTHLTEDTERVFSLFPRLAERRDQDGGTLSGGEQQMLAIGRALMGRPRVLLLDEPSMGLAPLVVQTIFEIIKQLNDEGVTVLLVEQNATQALRLADRGYVLETGTMAMHGAAKDLLGDDRVRKVYLGEG